VILVVDDKLADADNLRRRIGRSAEVITRTPDEIVPRELRRADLVLVDYELTEWEGAGNGVLTNPPNGLALASVMREQIGEIEQPGTAGVALYSGRLDQISGTLPEEVRGFAVARLHNLEWVFEKKDDTAHVGILALARAITTLPAAWPDDAEGAGEAVHAFLGLDSKIPFFELAAEDIDAAHPPIHELSRASHALAMVRWLAQRILPYPAFLIDQIGLAARLRLDPDDLAKVLAGKSRLAGALEGASYEGALAALLGPHWWRSGIDNLIFEWTDGTGDAEMLEASLSRLSARRLKFGDGDMVPVIDETYRARGTASIETAVRVRPDDWPVFADDAWAERAEVLGTPRLRGLLLEADRGRLEEDD